MDRILLAYGITFLLLALLLVAVTTTGLLLVGILALARLLGGVYWLPLATLLLLLVGALPLLLAVGEPLSLALPWAPGITPEERLLSWTNLVAAVLWTGACGALAMRLLLHLRNHVGQEEVSPFRAD